MAQRATNCLLKEVDINIHQPSRQSAKSMDGTDHEEEERAMAKDQNNVNVCVCFGNGRPIQTKHTHIHTDTQRMNIYYHRIF